VLALAPEPGVSRSPHPEPGEVREPVRGEYPLTRPARGPERVLALEPPAAWAYRLPRPERVVRVSEQAARVSLSQRLARALDLLPAALGVPGAFQFRAPVVLPVALQEEWRAAWAPESLFREQALVRAAAESREPGSEEPALPRAREPAALRPVEYQCRRLSEEGGAAPDPSVEQPTLRPDTRPLNRRSADRANPPGPGRSQAERIPKTGHRRCLEWCWRFVRRAG
jgi:hypothetical protein